MIVSEALTPTQKLELAVQVKSPARLAQVFAACSGQFYDRSDFDALARRARDLYAAEDPERALLFRARLDRRLYDRYRDPVAWDVASPAEHAASPCPPAA